MCSRLKIYITRFKCQWHGRQTLLCSSEWPGQTRDCSKYSLLKYCWILAVNSCYTPTIAWHEILIKPWLNGECENEISLFMIKWFKTVVEENVSRLHTQSCTNNTVEWKRCISNIHLLQLYVDNRQGFQCCSEGWNAKCWFKLVYDSVRECSELPAIS